MNAEAAQRYVEEAIVLDEGSKENYELLGDAYEKQGDIDKAVESYKKVFSMDNKYLSVCEKLIQLYLKNGNYEGVLAHCDTVMSYIPVDVLTAKARTLTSIYLSCVLYKGWALVYLNHYEDAVKEISRRKELYIDTKAPIYPRMFKGDDEAFY
jgi:Tfp pilus assembly protein PilF